MTTMRWTRACLTAGAVWLVASAAGLSAASAQLPEALLPDECKKLGNETKLSLDTRKSDLEKSVKTLQQRLEAASLTQRRDAERNLRKAQEDLLEVVFLADCLRIKGPSLPPPPPIMAERKADAPFKSRGLAPPPPPVAAAPPPSGGADRAAPVPRSVSAAPPASPDAVEVVTYYATNRKAGDVTKASTAFLDERGGPLLFGRAVVSIPRNHVPGTIELPTLWKFERTPDPTKHFLLKSVTPLGSDATRKEISDRLGSASEKSMLIFVHGYNSNFEYAALRTAQLAYDLQFPGIPFFYSWPSANRVRSYLQDEETAELSEKVFEQLLNELSKLPLQSVYIVAHSMGNRVVAKGLQRYVSAGGKTEHIKELLLAAPDINAEIFEDEIVPRLAQMRGTRTTIYASSFDIALIASKVVHGYRRVGESSGGVLVFKGMDTVDASSASSSLRNLGHSYVVDSASVIKDVRTIIASKLEAKARGLLSKGQDPNLYWQLPE